MRALLLGLLICGGSLEARETYLSAEDISAIQQNWPDYKYAAQKAGVPLLILAAIHYRESDLKKGWYSTRRKKIIRNIGGPFMLDLGPVNDNVEFTKRIREHEHRIYRLYGGKAGCPPKVSHDFRFSVLVAAHHLKIKAHDPIKTGDCTALLHGEDDCLFETDECIAYAVWGYNGRAAWQVDKKGKRTHRASSYVWADFKNGVKMTMRYTKRDGTVKRFTDTRPGVMVIYRELRALFHSENIRIACGDRLWR